MATLEEYALMPAAAYDERRCHNNPNQFTLHCAHCALRSA